MDPAIQNKKPAVADRVTFAYKTRQQAVRAARVDRYFPTAQRFPVRRFGHLVMKNQINKQRMSEICAFGGNVL